MESISIETSTILGDAESMDAVISEVRKGLLDRRSNVGAEFRNPGRRSVGLLIRVVVVRPPART
jgi:hypothetical protein